MKDTSKLDAKERIINASIKLFSQKGYDATRVNEIADEAGVTKALIYYYFKSKEEILDHLVQSLLDSAASIAMDFLREIFMQMIKEGQMKMEEGRLRFANQEAVEYFLQSAHKYIEQLLDFALENRAIIRILTLESLKGDKHQSKLFQMLKLGEDAPILKTISQGEGEFYYTDDLKLFLFFFSIIPLVSFAAYFDDYQEISSLSDSEMRSSFVRSVQIVLNSLISESSYLMHNAIKTRP
ncbi:MAG: helix-turn-helix domain-containing protein [Dethiobacteria bacterium]|nr:TetR/AcrR family transcriptional regulator [Bacillota bacterium]HPT33192.1 helix-turn-helix domain-containing protein [Bacillota bacterium]